MKTSSAVAAVALALAGCITEPPPKPIHTPPLDCVGDDQCKLYWERAQVWVVKNSNWKIQIATDVLIQTYNAAGTLNHYTLMREPQGGGVERITMTTGCGSTFSRCQVRSDVARRSLYEFVTNAPVDGWRTYLPVVR